MITCKKCAGKIFVDLTFTDNRNFETFCLRCGDRKFIGKNHPQFLIISDYVKSALVA